MLYVCFVPSFILYVITCPFIHLFCSLPIHWFIHCVICPFIHVYCSLPIHCVLCPYMYSILSFVDLFCYLSIHSFCYLSIGSFIHSFIHSLLSIHSFIHSCILLSVHSFCYLPIQSFIHSAICPFIHDGVAQLVEHQTRDPKTRGLNPVCVRSTRKICESFSRVKHVVLTCCRCAQPPAFLRTHKNDYERTLKIL